MTIPPPPSAIAEDPAPPLSAAPEARGLRRAGWFLRLAAGLLLLWLLARYSGGQEVGAALQRLGPAWMLLSVVFYLVGQLMCVVKWQLLLRTYGRPVRLKECARWYLAGMFWNLWMPTNIGGDAVRAWGMGRSTGYAAAAATTLLDRVTGLVALLLLAVLGAVLGAGDTGRLLPAIIAGVAGVMVLASGWWLLPRLVGSGDNASGWRKKASSAINAVGAFSSTRGRKALLWSFIISLVFQVFQVLHNLVLGELIGLQLTTAQYLWLVPALALASVLPVGIGGLGVREAAALTLLAGQPDIAPARIVAWSLVWQATIWFSSLGGIFTTGRATENIKQLEGNGPAK